MAAQIIRIKLNMDLKDSVKCRENILTRLEFNLEKIVFVCLIYLLLGMLAVERDVKQYVKQK